MQIASGPGRSAGRFAGRPWPSVGRYAPRSWRPAMVISIKTLSGSDPAAYYLQREVGCEAGYYLDPAEPTGRWVGDGAKVLELTGPLDEASETALRRILAGQHPLSGEQLAGPVRR